MLPVLRTEQAEADLSDVLEYLEKGSPSFADRQAHYSDFSAATNVFANSSAGRRFNDSLTTRINESAPLGSPTRMSCFLRFSTYWASFSAGT